MANYEVRFDPREEVSMPLGFDRSTRRFDSDNKVSEFLAEDAYDPELWVVVDLDEEEVEVGGVMTRDEFRGDVWLEDEEDARSVYEDMLRMPHQRL